MEKKKILSKKKEINPRDVSICDATIQMLEKAKRDGVETAFDRAASMRACPIGSVVPKYLLAFARVSTME